jgi:hypothetical protein
VALGVVDLFENGRVGNAVVRSLQGIASSSQTITASRWRKNQRPVGPQVEHLAGP